MHSSLCLSGSALCRTALFGMYRKRWEEHLDDLPSVSGLPHRPTTSFGHVSRERVRHVQTMDALACQQAPACGQGYWPNKRRVGGERGMERGLGTQMNGTRGCLWRWRISCRWDIGGDGPHRIMAKHRVGVEPLFCLDF